MSPERGKPRNLAFRDRVKRDPFVAIRRLSAILALSGLLAALLTLPGTAGAAECEPKSSCFGLESVAASLSTYQAGAHPDLTLSFTTAQNPTSPPNVFGLHRSYASVKDVRIETPPGLIGNPNLLGSAQQCTVTEFVNYATEGCPNGSQVGVTSVVVYDLTATFTEPVYMMVPPEGGDTVARLGFIAGVFPVFIDLHVRSNGDYGLTAELRSISPTRGFGVDTTLWGVPADPSHDTERCTSKEAFEFCTQTLPRPPGSRPLAFLTNPTSCPGTAGQVAVSADSWVEPGRFVGESASLEPISGCNRVPFNPSLTAEPTSHRAAAPTGLELSFKLPAPEGTEVLEGSQLKDMRIDFPPGVGINTASADGLGTCSAEQVHFKENVASECPDSAKLADTEFDIPALPRRMRGAIYLREPEPGHLFRIWVVADDLGAHVKLPGELEVDQTTGQIRSVLFNLPQAPLREVRLLLKSGFRAPLVNPQKCGTYQTHWEFTPWSGTGTVSGDSPMRVDEGCETGAFAPRLSAGSTNPSAGAHAPFAFDLTRADGEQNPASLDITLPRGLAATFAAIPHCEGAAAVTGQCPPDSRIGRVLTATGAGPTPLWTPEAGKRPTAVYLGGPYKGAPTSIVAVVPAQAGPFDLGDQVVRSPIFVDPSSARATAKSDPLPQIIQGIPILYRTIEVVLDRPDFTLNPTSCEPKQTTTRITSTDGQVATPSAYYQATGCSSLGFKPKLSLKLKGATHRGAHPALRATVKMPPGGANIAAAAVALPRSEFLDQGHIGTVCTRVQFAEGAGNGERCPPASIYGYARAKTPLFDFPVEGPVYLRSSSHNLPDLVAALKGPPSMPIAIDLDGRVDSIHGGIRNTFEVVPDAPVSEFTLSMQGGRKGLLQNSEDLCAGAHRATARFSGQNGRVKTLHPALQAKCGHKKKGGKRKHRR